MPTALTLMEASTVHVERVLKAMDSIAQVFNNKHSTKQVRIYIMSWLALFNILLQTFLSVKESWMIVTQMQLA